MQSPLLLFLSATVELSKWSDEIFYSNLDCAAQLGKSQCADCDSRHEYDRVLFNEGH
ncbi:hypothetical protein D322_3127 [Yersinia enterocolitica IP 10393]|nr:hypothetical protein D322_3127 [Yersinia enterocolitica IP 10393]